MVVVHPPPEPSGKTIPDIYKKKRTKKMRAILIPAEDEPKQVEIDDLQDLRKQLDCRTWEEALEAAGLPE